MRREMTFLCRLFDFLTTNVCRPWEVTSNQKIYSLLKNSLWNFVWSISNMARNVDIYPVSHMYIYLPIFMLCIYIILIAEDTKSGSLDYCECEQLEWHLCLTGQCSIQHLLISKVTFQRCSYFFLLFYAHSIHKSLSLGEDIKAPRNTSASYYEQRGLTFQSIK